LVAVTLGSGHNLTTQVRKIIPGHRGVHRAALTQARQRGGGFLVDRVFQDVAQVVATLRAVRRVPLHDVLAEFRVVIP